ncbi:hypothetical protein D3C85_1170430 [compost metagenome]
MNIICRYTSSFSSFNILFSFFPIDGHDKILIIFRSVYLKQGIGLLSVVTGEKEPTVRFFFPRMTKIKINTRSYDLKSKIQLSFFTHFYKTKVSFKVFLICINGYISIVIICGNAKTACPHNILCVLRDKRRRMVSSTIWKLDYLSCFKSFQVNTCNPWRIIGIGKKPAPVNFSIGLR